MQIKWLVQKFTYDQLEEECPKQGWRIPKKVELEGKDLPLHIFVSDPAEDPHYAVMYDGKTEVLVSRKHNLMNTGVIKVPCTATFGKKVITFDCTDLPVLIEDAALVINFEYCPYCGKELIQRKK